MSLRVGWFLPTDKRDFNRMSASVWIRCLQLLPYLEERGVDSKVNEPDADADVAVFVRWQDGQAYRLARRLRKKGQRVVFDLCVNYFDETGLFEGGYGTPRERVKECARMAQVADVITCASAFIAERAQKHHPWAVYLPDSIDGRHFRVIKDAQDFGRPDLRAVFSGTSQKAGELEPILPLLRSRGMSLTVIANAPPPLSIPYRFVPWAYETFPQHIVEGEICVAHRPVDNPYNKGHSLFKVGVFMFQGVPAIASPVPSYKEVVTNGTGGSLCESLEEWGEVLDLALSDREQLVRWSKQARANMEDYRTDLVVDRYVELFRSLMEFEPRDEGREAGRDGLLKSGLDRVRGLWRSDNLARRR